MNASFLANFSQYRAQLIGTGDFSVATAMRVLQPHYSLTLVMWRTSNQNALSPFEVNIQKYRLHRYYARIMVQSLNCGF